MLQIMIFPTSDRSSGAASSYGPELAGLLREAGAAVDARTISSGHAFEDADIGIVREWLRARSL